MHRLSSLIRSTPPRKKAKFIYHIGLVGNRLIQTQYTDCPPIVNEKLLKTLLNKTGRPRHCQTARAFDPLGNRDGERSGYEKGARPVVIPIPSRTSAHTPAGAASRGKGRHLPCQPPIGMGNGNRRPSPLTKHFRVILCVFRYWIGVYLIVTDPFVFCRHN